MAFFLPIPELNFLRGGSLDLTRRSVGEDPPWANDEKRTIQVDQGLTVPMVLTVRKFCPPEDDVLARKWRGRHGEPKSTPIAPYALANCEETKRYLEGYISKNCLCFPNAAKASHGLVSKVYRQMDTHIRGFISLGGDDGESPLNGFSEIWFGTRMSGHPCARR